VFRDRAIRTDLKEELVKLEVPPLLQFFFFLTLEPRVE